MDSRNFNRLLKRYPYSHKAVDELFDYYYPLIVMYIAREFRGKIDGEDVAQEFFFRLFKNKAYDIRAPDAWVRVVTKHIALEMLRKETRQQEAEARAAPPDKTEVPEDNTDDILKCLSPIERQVVHLCYWELYRLKEIAELLQMKYGLVKRIHKAAKIKLKRELDHEKDK